MTKPTHSVLKCAFGYHDYIVPTQTATKSSTIKCVGCGHILGSQVPLKGSGNFKVTIVNKEDYE